MKITGVKITENGIRSLVDIHREYELKELQALVRGYIEVVHLRNGCVMIVDEEGQLKGRPINDDASALAGQMIVGDVVVLGPPTIDGDFTSVGKTMQRVIGVTS